MDGYFLEDGRGEAAELGIVCMRVIVSKARTNGTFGIAEFRGSEGAWTVPHVHRHMEESFYVLEGTFDFACGERRVQADKGAFLMVPRDTPHVMAAGPGGGTLLVVFTPAGLEDMFLELGRLPANSITDPGIRAAIASRYDSIPV
ncbi:MAG: cupin domain-containing protein [Actinomycetota bacterium]|nr:cupin domain-containing protein [Actinomycetota bacterium]